MNKITTHTAVNETGLSASLYNFSSNNVQYVGCDLHASCVCASGCFIRRKFPEHLKNLQFLCLA